MLASVDEFDPNTLLPNPEHCLLTQEPRDFSFRLEVLQHKAKLRHGQSTDPRIAAVLLCKSVLEDAVTALGLLCLPWMPG